MRDLNRIHLVFLAAFAPLCILMMPQRAACLTCRAHDSYTMDSARGQLIYKRSEIQRHSEAVERAVEGADIASFEVLQEYIAHWAACTSPYATDKSHVYYQGEVIEGLEPGSFRKMSKGYYRDNEHIVFGGEVLDNADAETFEMSEGALYRDKNFVYVYRRAIVRSEFQRLGEGQNYVRDKTTVFYRGEPIAVDIATFEVVSGRGTDDSYTKDSNGVYYIREPIPGADLSTFEWISAYYAKDARRVYNEGRAIEGARPSHFQLLDCQYSKDDKTVFTRYGREKLDRRDALSFETFRFCSYSKDRNGVYYRDELVSGVDVDTFRLFSSKGWDRLKRVYFGTDKDHTYLRELRVAEGVDPSDFDESYFQDKAEPTPSDSAESHDKPTAPTPLYFPPKRPDQKTTAAI